MKDDYFDFTEDKGEGEEEWKGTKIVVEITKKDDQKQLTITDLS